MRGAKNIPIEIVGAAPPTARFMCAHITRNTGFTLVELLVALAIFVTVMASVALVFNGAVRTSKQGFQNQEAFELARGTMKVLERDISRAFTNRDHGDDFNFYGTPIGFTYVGLISADESSAPNMARVTYVVYHDLASSIAGSVAQYESKEGGTVPTYTLLRYIEPGADSLDSFPIDWSVDVTLDSGSPITLDSVASATVARAGCPDLGCEELVRQAARRQIWVLMVSGGGDVDTDGDGIVDDSLPSAWSPSAWAAIPSFTDLDPADYVVGEHIRYLDFESQEEFSGTQYCADTQADLEALLAGFGFTLDYDDRIYSTSTQVCATLKSDVGVAPVFDVTTPAVFSPVNGAQPFFTYWDIAVIPNNLNTTADDQHTPIAFQFWNDSRNMLADGFDNDGDGTIDEIDEQYAESSGSPLDTRLPIAVTTDFTLFFQSPYPGAPDFNERFTQRIDLPTAYRRTFKNSVPVTP